MNSQILSRYVLITAARNEEAFIEKTISSVIQQTVLPLKWIIVSDSSTDRTDDIIKCYLKSHPYLHFLRRTGDDRRNFGSQVHAINAGRELLHGLQYDCIGNLDADVSFSSDYFESLLKRFSANPRLGLAGGCIYEETEGRFAPRSFNRRTSVPHAVQLFRMNCFEDVGGYVPLKYGGPDWYAEVMARRSGWQVESFRDLPVYHHKPGLTSEGRLRGGFRQGRMDYSLGSSPVFELLRCLARVRRPYGPLYSAYRFAGFSWGYLIREGRPVSSEFIRYLRTEQREKIINAIIHPFRERVA